MFIPRDEKIFDIVMKLILGAIIPLAVYPTILWLCWNYGIAPVIGLPNYGWWFWLAAYIFVNSMIYRSQNTRGNDD